MKQVLLDARGRVQVVELPSPLVGPGRVLVRTVYSLISTGTETAAVRHRSTGLLRRAASRPDSVRVLAQQTRSGGLGATADLAAAKLMELTPLGYSLAGTVVETGDGVTGPARGDLVACVGAEHAHHAGVVSVPHLLAVPVPDGVPMRAAAFGAVGAIALHAVRRSKASIGESVAVVGLGLVGQIVCQILRAAGCRVLGIEPRRDRADLAKRLGLTTALEPDDADLQERARAATDGLGADAVIVTATATGSEPANLALALARERGRVVLVGDVGLSLDREPFYRKELDVVMSRSLGPGRYDPAYEEEGRDYHAPYARWTEARNVRAFLDLLAAGAVDVDSLVSAEVAVEDAADAYDRLRSGDAVAVVLRYAEPPAPAEAPAPRRLVPAPGNLAAGPIGLAVVGPGAFARAVHLPTLRRSQGFAVRWVVGRTGLTAHRAAARIRDARAATGLDDALADPSVAAVWVTTPHDSHAAIALRALEAGKHVFVEKPLALTLEDCRKVAETAAGTGRLLTVGFNRRFAPASGILKDHFRDTQGPCQILYRVRADALPPGHWLDDPARGGGRLLGEACHFFDWMAWLLGEEPIRVWATGQTERPMGVVVAIEFAGGSRATLTYTLSGATSTPKEHIEVLWEDRTAVLDDFRTVELRAGSGRPRRRRAAGKGHREQLRAFERALRGDDPPAVTAADGMRATAVGLAAMVALREGEIQEIPGA